MNLTALLRRHQHGDPTNGQPIEILKLKCSKTCLQVFLYGISTVYNVDKTCIQNVRFSYKKLKLTDGNSLRIEVLSSM
jgi:hypothetical protein